MGLSIWKIILPENTFNQTHGFSGNEVGRVKMVNRFLSSLLLVACC